MGTTETEKSTVRDIEAVRNELEIWLQYYTARYINTPRHDKAQKERLMGRIELCQDALNFMDGVNFRDPAVEAQISLVDLERREV